MLGGEPRLEGATLASSFFSATNESVCADPFLFLPSSPPYSCGRHCHGQSCAHLRNASFDVLLRVLQGPFGVAVTHKGLTSRSSFLCVTKHQDSVSANKAGWYRYTCSSPLAGQPARDCCHQLMARRRRALHSGGAPPVKRPSKPISPSPGCQDTKHRCSPSVG